MMDYPPEYLVPLREAMDIVKTSVVPGALNVDGKQLLQYDEEQNMYVYHVNIDDRQSPLVDVSDDRLEQDIPGAKDCSWIPVSNFIIL